MILDAFEKISKIIAKCTAAVCITALELHVAGCHVAKKVGVTALPMQCKGHSKPQTARYYFQLLCSETTMSNIILNIIIQLHDVLVLICTCAVCIVCTNVCVPTYNHIHVQLEVYLAKPCSAEIEGRSVSRTCLVGKVFHTQCVCHTIDLEIFIVKINIAVHASFLFDIHTLTLTG